MFRKISEWSHTKKVQREAANAERKALQAKQQLAHKLRYAAARGDLDTVLRVIKECGRDLAVINHAVKGNMLKRSDGLKIQAYQPNAVFLAARNGQLGTLKALLEVPGVDVNAEADGYQGKTPLLAAIVYGKKQCAFELARHPSVKPNYSTLVCRYIAVIVAVSCMPEVIPVLAARHDFNPNVVGGAKQTALHLLCQVKGDSDQLNLDCIKALAHHKKTAINACDKHNYTPLMHAAANGKIKACKVLLEWGADKTLRNNIDCDAARLADLNGHAEIAHMIRNYSGKNRHMSRLVRESTEDANIPAAASMRM